MKELDEGIFLHKIAYGDTSLILRFFTKKHGTMSFMMKGGRKKKGFVLQPLGNYEITYLGKPNQLQLLTSCDDISVNFEIQESMLKTSIAFFMAEIFNQCLHESPADETIFEFIENEMTWLNHTEELTNFPIWLLVEISSRFGFCPSIVGNPNIFDLREGLIGEKVNHAFSIEDDSIEYLRNSLELDKYHFLALDIPKPIRTKLLNHLMNYFKLHLPGFRGLKSIEVIQEILA